MIRKSLIILISLFIVITGLSLQSQAIKIEKPYDVPVPAEFGEAPQLEELVQAGELPSVEERLPEDPLVVKPNDNIGDYGGTARAATISLTTIGEDHMMMDTIACFVRPSPDASELQLNLAKDIEVKDDMSTYIIYLREGIKWSDGEPFTTEDIEFWYEDLLLNKEYTSVVPLFYKNADGEIMDLNVIDEYTFEVKFGTPKPFFLSNLIHKMAFGWLIPKHYVKQYHPDYVEEEVLEQRLDEHDFDHWYNLLDDMKSGWGQAKYVEDVPTLGAYVLTSMETDRRVYERNPYFWKVDSEGNQLPYIDRIETALVSNREVLNGKIMSGEIDFAGYQTDIRNYPMFKKYEEEGNYRTILWTSGFMSDVIYMFNHNHEDENMREIFQNTQFKRAMSLAIDRDEINESIYFGKAEPAQMTVLPSSKYYKPEFEEAFVEYDPERAKEMLTEIGLEDQNGDGWRQLPNGDKFQFSVQVVARETPKLPNVELVIGHWRDVGIDAQYEEISGSLAGQRSNANKMDANLWHGDRGTDIMFPRQPLWYVPMTTGWHKTIFPLWSNWCDTDGESGEEPPAEIKKLRGWYEDMQGEPDEDRRLELGHKILKKQAENLWAIGTVGRSPWIAIANDNLRNLPEDVLWVWDTLFTTTRDPEQFYFEDGSRASQ